MNQHGKLFAKICKATAKLPNGTMAYPDPSYPLLKVTPTLSAETTKYSYQHLAGKMGQLPDMKKRMILAAIVRKWVERIWVMGSDVCIL